MKRVIVAALLNLVPLERRPDEDRDDQLLLLARHLRERKHGPGARALAARADNDDDRVFAQELFALRPSTLVQRLRRELRIVPAPQDRRVVAAPMITPLFLRHRGERELVGVEEPRGYCPPQPLGVLGIGLAAPRPGPGEKAPSAIAGCCRRLRQC